jgi:2-methylfumaryl-CoA hydratase
MIHEPRYGRLLDDFVPGDVYVHPWEVTVDEGMLALFAGSFQDALPTYASRVAARELGLRDRPVHPLFLLDLALSLSVHDVSERAIAHLAYVDVRFPDACYAGDTLTARSRVVGVKPVSSGDKGVVHVRTELVADAGALVCAFDRKALVRAGKVEDRPRAAAPQATTVDFHPNPPRAPAALLGPLPPRKRQGGFAWYWEDFVPGDVIVHGSGRTVSEAEHMQLSTLMRNSHPLHVDEHSCKTSSFAKTRVVYGGLVLSWVLALTSRDTAGNAVWDMGLDDGAHPSGVLAGDTLYAASKVLSTEARGPDAGTVTLRVVGLKNATARPLLDRGLDLFAPELGKTTGKVPEKVVEITRTLLVRRRPT